MHGIKYQYQRNKKSSIYKPMDFPHLKNGMKRRKPGQNWRLSEKTIGMSLIAVQPPIGRQNHKGENGQDSEVKG